MDTQAGDAASVIDSIAAGDDTAARAAMGVAIDRANGQILKALPAEGQA